MVVLLLVAALVAWELTRGSAPSYRTSVVGTGTVAATLDSVATITPVNQANLNFDVSGTVSSVDVSVGQTVASGQTLASLDLADLDANVISAQATLESATATLTRAEASEATTASAPSSSTPGTESSQAGGATTASTASTGTATTPAGSGRSGSDTQKVAGLQEAVVTDERQLDAATTQATAGLKQATSVCETGGGPKGSAVPGTSGSSQLHGPPATSPGSTGTPTCSQALAQTTSAQSAVSAAAQKLSHDERTLDAALESTSGPGGGSSSSRGSTATTGSPTVPASSGSATDPTAVRQATPQQLAVDQASIDTAQATLNDAQLALLGSNLVSTISGTVASVSIAPGDSVAAGSGSSTAQIVIIGTGSSYDVSTDIPVADIGKVAVGQQALVTPDATNTVVQGRVTSIGVLATSGSTTTTYPVTIALESTGLGGLSGSDADVEIIVQKSVDVTTVPSSAVRTVGSVNVVTVMDGTTAKATPVTLGTVGDVLTQVKSGVAPGERVVLADLDQPLPTTSTSSLRTGFGGGMAGGGGFGGGGVAGGGGFGSAARFGG